MSRASKSLAVIRHSWRPLEMIFLLYLLQTLWWAPLLTFSFGYIADIFAVFILKNILQNPAVWASQYQWGSRCRNWKAQVGASRPCDRRHRSELGACYFKRSGGGEGGAGMGDDEVLCQSVEAVVRVACDHSSINFFICSNSVFLDSFESSLSIVPEELFLFSLCHCPFQICTLDIQMPFILGGFPRSTSCSNIHSGSFLTGFHTLDI